IKTAMNPIFPCILLLLSLSGTFTKYVYIEEKYSWKEALDYCCQHHTDLAPVNNQRDIHILQELSGGTTEKIWIGLIRRSSDKNKWLWSGGGEVSRFFWEVKQPDNKSNDNYGYTEKNRWHDSDGGGKEHFFCYWPEALKYCREHHNDLASVASETEMMLIQKELKKHNTTEHVWIGLRFLSREWLWVDKQEMGYEAWGDGGKPLCPHPKMKCGALQVTGGTQGVWEAHDCVERLNFILKRKRFVSYFS
uniref:C-type lectin domain-containing protein n=1 Tax=Pundamilia nyererei TaxID=303518 RepID=A0A3B4H6T4_9CICH